MLGARTYLTHLASVKFGGIALVYLEFIFGIFFCHFKTVAVTLDLGKY